MLRRLPQVLERDVNGAKFDAAIAGMFGRPPIVKDFGVRSLMNASSISSAKVQHGEGSLGSV
jgi:hypothetical protein